MLGRVRTALEHKDMGLEITEKAKSLLAKRGFDPVLGARPLRRTIQREIEDPLSEKLLFGEMGAGEIVTVDVDDWDGESKSDKVKFVFGSKPKPLPEAEDDTPADEAQHAVVDAADGHVPEDESDDNGPNATSGKEDASASAQQEN